MSSSPDRRPEVQERLNRQLAEALQETRVVMPGAQLLFGFLLAVPFNGRFVETTEAERVVYLVALLTVAASSACLIAPAAYHRLVFQHGDRPRVIRLAARALVAAIVLLAIATTSAVLLVTSFLLPTWTALVLTASVAAMVVGLWFLLALRREATRS